MKQEVIDRMFQYTAPTEDNRAKFEELTALWNKIGERLNVLCPDCPEKVQAFLTLDVLRFHANSAIVRGACDPNALTQ